MSMSFMQFSAEWFMDRSSAGLPKAGKLSKEKTPKRGGGVSWE